VYRALIDPQALARWSVPETAERRLRATTRASKFARRSHRGRRALDIATFTSTPCADQSGYSRSYRHQGAKQERRTRAVGDAAFRWDAMAPGSIRSTTWLK
jgi:hypothetical protein